MVFHRREPSDKVCFRSLDGRGRPREHHVVTQILLTSLLLVFDGEISLYYNGNTSRCIPKLMGFATPALVVISSARVGEFSFIGTDAKGMTTDVYPRENCIAPDR